MASRAWPRTVEAQQAGLISLGTGGAVLLASLSFLLGAVTGGIVLPFAMADQPDMAAQQQADDRSAALSQLRVSLAPLAVWAPPSMGSPAVSTGLSLGQLIEELDFRGRRAGRASTISVARDGGVVTVDLAFQEVPEAARTMGATGKAGERGHPALIRLVLASGPVPGSLVLTETLADSRPLPTGASFVDLVAMGGIAPPLPDGHILTRLGVFEIRTGDDGVQTAWLDGRAFYPGPGTPDVAAPESKSTDAGAAAASEPARPARPVRLSVVSQDPVSGPFRQRLVLVAAPASAGPCTARAAIFDSTRNAMRELPHPLLAASVEVAASASSLTLRGFCAPTAAGLDETGATGPAPAAPAASTSPAGAAYGLEAVYSSADGTVRWNRVALPDLAAGAPSVAPGGPWRSSEGRLASPIQPGGGLVSLSCQGAGGVSVAASGLPTPPDGEAGLSVVFRSPVGAAPARMRWIAGSATYELSATGRPREAAAVLGVLRAGGDITVEGGGVRRVIPGPGAAAVAQMQSRCGAAPAATRPQTARSPSPQPVPRPEPKAPAQQPVPDNRAPAPSAPAEADPAPQERPAASPPPPPRD